MRREREVCRWEASAQRTNAADPAKPDRGVPQKVKDQRGSLNRSRLLGGEHELDGSHPSRDVAFAKRAERSEMVAAGADAEARESSPSRPMIINQTCRSTYRLAWSLGDLPQVKPGDRRRGSETSPTITRARARGRGGWSFLALPQVLYLRLARTMPSSKML